MNSQVPYLLRDIIRTHGVVVVSSVSRCDAYLADLLFEYAKERHYLVTAVKEGVVDALLSKTDSEQLHSLSKRLAKAANLEPAEALGIINAWRFALSDNPLSMEAIKPAQRSGLWALMVGVTCCLVLGGLVWSVSQYFPTGWSAVSSAPSVPDVAVETPIGELVPVDEELESMLQKQETEAEQTLESMNTASTVSEELYIDTDDAPATTESTIRNAESTRATQAAIAQSRIREGLNTLPIIETANNDLDKAVLAEKSNNALYALQRFVNDAFILQKKKKAQETVGRLSQSTRQPYYQQQYQTLSKQIKDLEQQLENSALQYGTAMDHLCELEQQYDDIVSLLSNSRLYRVMDEHLRRCKSGNNTNRQQLEKDIQQWSSTSQR